MIKALWRQTIEKQKMKNQSLVCVAPMMAWTDKHCRFLHRQYTPSALLFTEMVTTGALLCGKQTHLLQYNECEHPVAVQLGGNDPIAMAECAAMAEEQGFDEVNINVGCPSDDSYAALSVSVFRCTSSSSYFDILRMRDFGWKEGMVAERFSGRLLSINRSMSWRSPKINEPTGGSLSILRLIIY